MGHRGIRVLKWSSTRSDRCALGSGGGRGRCAQNSQGYQRHPPPGRAQNARLTSTPHFPHLWNGNTPTLSLTRLHEGTVSAAITEVRMLHQEAAPLMGHCHTPTAMPEPLLKGFCLNLNQPQAATILTFVSGTFPALGDMHHKAPWRKAWVTLIFQIYFMENKLFYGKLQPCPKQQHKLHMPTTQIPRSSDNQPQSFTHLTSARLFKKQIPFNKYLWMNSIYHYRTQNHNSMITPSTIKQLLLNLCQSHTCLKYTGSPIAFFSIICWRNQVICPISLDWALQGASLWYNESVKSCQSPSHIWLFVAPWTVACSTSLSMEFFRQENWSGEPFPSPGDLPNPGIEPSSLALQADSSPSESPEIHTRNTPPISYKLDFEAKSSIHPSESTCTLPWGWGWRAGSYWGPLRTTETTILLGVCKCMNL